MGKKQHKLGIRLDDEQIARIDKELSIWRPFCSRRSTMAEALIDVALDVIEAGIVQRPIITLQQLQRPNLLTAGENVAEASKDGKEDAA